MSCIYCTTKKVDFSLNFLCMRILLQRPFTSINVSLTCSTGMSYPIPLNLCFTLPIEKGIMISIFFKLLLQKLRSLLVELMKYAFLLLFFYVETSVFVEKNELLFHVVNLFCLLVFFILKSYFSRPAPVYLVDFSCFKPPNFCRVPFSTFIEHSQMLEFLDEESTAFMAKVLMSSGQGEQTYLPPALHYIPPRSTHRDAMQELHMVLFPVFEDLLSKTKLSPRDIDVLIVNCSGFCPAPSLSAIIVNRFSMREDVKSFTLSGMGCSASALAIDMAKNILKTRKNSNAVILSTEILSTGWYPGKDRSMMVLNCTFRMGAAAILVSNKEQAKREAKYKLLWSLRTQRASDDKGYHSAMREEDSDGLTGVTLRRDLLQVAGETLRSNMAILGAKTLPFTEKIWYGISLICKKFIDKSTEIYVPNFKPVIQHFCLPTSGKPIINEFAKGLKLGEKDIEPALMTLHRFGNQSSSSIWYELAYTEAEGRMKKGDKVWQLGMGTGLKCNSLVWECIRPIFGEACKGPWADSTDRYPFLAHNS